MISKLMCKYFGHKWMYNFTSLPSKAICRRCKCKSRFDIKELEWNVVDDFAGDKRTDEQLIEIWC